MVVCNLHKLLHFMLHSADIFLKSSQTPGSIRLFMYNTAQLVKYKCQLRINGRVYKFMSQPVYLVMWVGHWVSSPVPVMAETGFSSRLENCRSTPLSDLYHNITCIYK